MLQESHQGARNIIFEEGWGNDDNNSYTRTTAKKKKLGIEVLDNLRPTYPNLTKDYHNKLSVQASLFIFEAFVSWDNAVTLSTKVLKKINRAVKSTAF